MRQFEEQCNCVVIESDTLTDGSQVWNVLLTFHRRRRTTVRLGCLSETHARDLARELCNVAFIEEVSS